MRFVPVSVLTLIMACASPPVQTVADVDLNRYTGTWHEIVSKPVFAQKGCRCTTARYTLKNNGDIEVYNRCLKGKDVSDITGTAWPVAGSNNSRLQVRFFWPFKGDYDIMALESDYSIALVGNPGRKTMWLLARKPELPDEKIQAYLKVAVANGYDLSNLQTTSHKDCQ